MARLPILVAITAAVALPAVARSQDPRTVVRTVTRAYETDRVEQLRRSYTVRVRRNAGDREAQLALATLARLEYDYPKAEGIYRRLADGVRDRYAVYARLGIAEGMETRSFGLRAAPEFERARHEARATGDRTAEGEALVWLAFSRGRLQGVRVAEAVLDTAARLVPPAAHDLWARIFSRRAIVAALRGQPRDASVAADSAIALARHAQDRRAEAEAHRMFGQVLQYRGQWDSALVALHASEKLYTESRSRSALASSLIWHAQVLTTIGRYGEMREVMRRALAEGEATNNPAAVADAHRAFGVLAILLGDWSSAAAHLNKSKAISLATGDSSGTQTTTTYLSQVALATGDVAAARRMTEERLAWAAKTETALSLMYAHQALADIAARERNWPEMERALRNARVQLATIPGANYRSWLDQHEARLALIRGDLATAERLLLRLIGPEDGGAAWDYSRFDSHVRLAYIHARRGDIGRAEAELERATDHFDRWRSRLGDTELRTLAFQTVPSVHAAPAEPTSTDRAAYILAALARGGRAAAAFSLAERWRARELTDQLTRTAALRPVPPAPLSRTAPVGAPTRSAADVMAALPDDRTALLEFVASEGAPITVFIVQRTGITARVLPAFDSLGATIDRFSALVESGADAARLGRALGSALLDSALALLDRKVTRLVVVPDGPLHRLPFDVLRLADGRYVLERYALGAAPSASVVVALWSRRPAASSAPARLLAFGDPAIPPQLVRARGASNGDGEPYLTAVRASGGLPRLKGASREARQVARYAAEADVRTGADASAAFLRRSDLRQYRVLHFAAHALVDEQSVAGTALVLAPGDGYSGFVDPGDLATLRLDADLVVLSACSAARGVLIRGEGLQGLTSPLLQAGARAVIATEWRIRDGEAVPFVETLYEELARGLPVVEALRAAKLRAIRGGAPPSTWAAFVAIGDPLNVVPLRAPPARWWSRLLR